MTIVSLADSCRQLSIDPKTLRHWLAQAPFTLQSPAHHACRKGLTEEQLCWLAQAHHRHLATLPQEPPQPALAPSTEALALPADLCEALVALRALPAQLAALQEQVADLSYQLCHLAGPAPTTSTRKGGTPKVATSRQCRGRAKSRSQPQRPSPAQVLALLEYAGEGRYVVLSPRGGLVCLA